MIEKILTSWPFTIPLVGLISLLLFKKEISSKIQTIFLVKHKDTEVSFEGMMNSQLAEVKKPDPLESFVLKEPIFDPILTHLDDHVRKQLEDAFGNDLKKQRDWAIRISSIASIERGHEFHYRIIFGSQIFFLKTLNQNAKVERDKAEKIFETARQAHQDLYRNFDFNNWISFLIQAMFIEVQQTSEDGEFFNLTGMGRNFLVWMTNQGVIENKLVS
jgi:hypothetical protein